jgi:hypothetical protein
LRAKVRIPKQVRFETKVELALDMIDRAAAAGIPGNVVLADCVHGESVDFRGSVRLLGFDYGLGVRAPTTVRLVGGGGRGLGEPIGVQQLGAKLGRKAFRRISWRDSTSGRKLWSRFCFRRVKVAADDGATLDDREQLVNDCLEATGRWLRAGTTCAPLRTDPTYDGADATPAVAFSYRSDSTRTPRTRPAGRGP